MENGLLGVKRGGKKTRQKAVGTVFRKEEGGPDWQPQGTPTQDYFGIMLENQQNLMKGQRKMKAIDSASCLSTEMRLTRAEMGRGLEITSYGIKITPCHLTLNLGAQRNVHNWRCNSRCHLCIGGVGTHCPRWDEKREEVPGLGASTSVFRSGPAWQEIQERGQRRKKENQECGIMDIWAQFQLTIVLVLWVLIVDHCRQCLLMTTK